MEFEAARVPVRCDHRSDMDPDTPFARQLAEIASDRAGPEVG
ncbi:MAG: hypothetical protein QOK02_170, partial [Mycobacterium sp.]|nr:hypothetical protein [Mycobacterium sp.]